MSIETDTERRVFPVTLHPETRSDGRLRLQGTAATFDSRSELIGDFYETIRPRAFRDAVKGDVFLFWMHNDDQPLARTGAGLELRETSKGLGFDALLPPTTLAKDASTLIRSGVISSMSFGFSMADGEDQWDQRDGIPHRTITKIGRLHEISVVGTPAYSESSVSARERERELVELRQATTATRERLKLKEPPPYGPEGKYSFFVDLLTVGRSEHVRHLLVDQGTEEANPHPGFYLGPADQEDTFDPAAARRRLQIGTEQRTMSTTVTAGGNLMRVYSPPDIAAQFAEAARAKAVLTSVMRTEPLDPSGMFVEIPRLSTGATAVIQSSQNSSLGTQDMVEALISAPVCTIGDYIDLSEQLAQRANPVFDSVIASELGRAYGQALDAQIINGSGSAGQLTGLLNVGSITSLSYTAGTPAQAGLWPQIMRLLADTASAFGTPPDILLGHPRRIAWLWAWKDSTTGMQAPLRFPPDVNVISTPGVPVTLGASTSEDVLITFIREQMPVYLAPPVFSTYPEVGSANLTTRIQVHAYVAFPSGRQPTAIGKLGGSGLASPVFA